MQTITELKEHFELSKNAFWELYAGRKKDSSRLLMKNLEESRIEKSFELLEKAIELNRTNNDNFTIVLKSKPSESAGVFTVNLDFDKTTGATTTTAIGTINREAEKEKTTLIGQLHDEKVARQINEIKNEHRWEIRDLKDVHNKEIENWKEKLRKAKGEDDPMKKAIGSMLMNAFIPTPAPVKTAVSYVEPEPTKAEQEKQEDIDLAGLDMNSTFISTSIIKKHIPHIENYLHNFSVILEEADEQTKALYINNFEKFFA